MNRLVVLVVLTAAAPAAYSDGPPAKSQPGYVDVAIVSGDRPLRVRLNITIDGRPLAQAWRGHMERWFRFLDRDGDGLLVEKELANAPVPLAMQQIMRQGNFFFGSGVGIPQSAMGDERGASLADFMAYYLQNGAGPLSIAPFAPFQDGQSDQLFRLLDKDSDGKLSKAELESADKLLRQLDADDDETVSAQEVGAGPQNVLGLGRAMMVGMMGNQGPANRPPPASLIQLGTKAGVKAVLDRYDKNKDGKLDPKEFPIAPQTFAELDADKDGSLDLAELRAWTERAPDAEWTAVWTADSVDARGGRSDGKHADVLALDDVDMQFRALPRAQRYSPAQYYLQLFKNADVSSRGELELKDLAQPQHTVLKQLFGVIDRNGDGKLTEKETREFVDLQTEALSCHATLAFADQGRGLFQMIDMDRDGRLSSRELRSAWKRLEPRDRNKDGFIEPNEIPRQCTLAVGFGYEAMVFRPGFNPNGPATPPRTNYPPNTPEWFVKMDANGDGEVSRREFLGSLEDFRRLDADDNGMISPEEAIRFAKK